VVSRLNAPSYKFKARDGRILSRTTRRPITHGIIANYGTHWGLGTVCESKEEADRIAALGTMESYVVPVDHIDGQIPAYHDAS
jgi:hypothetical protein